MPDIKTVKINLEANVTKARDAVTSLANKFKELKTSSKGIELPFSSQVQKIGQLKEQINQLKSLYAQLNSVMKKQATAVANRDTTFYGMPDYAKYSNQINQYESQIESLRESLIELTGANRESFGGADVQSKIYELTNALKEEENAFKQSGNEASTTAKKHQTFGQALSKIGSVAKKVKGQISSIIGNIKSFASSIKGAIPGANKFGGVLGKLASQFKRLFVMRIMRNAISAMIKGFKEGIDAVVQYSAALNGLDSNNANGAMSELASTAQFLKNTLGSAVIPVLNAVIPLVRQLATAFATAVNYVNQFVSALGGKSSWTRAKQVTVDYASTLNGVGSSAGGAKDAVEDLKRTIMGFDEINKLNDASGSSGSGGSGSGGGGSDSVNYADMFEEVPIDNKVMEWLKDLKPYIDAIKTAWDGVKTAVSELVNSQGFKYVVGEVFKGVLKTIETALTVIGSLVRTFNDIINNSDIQAKIGGISEAWDGVLTSIKGLVESPGFKKVLEAATYVVLTTIQTILESIKGFIDGIKQALNNLDESGKLEEFKQAWDNISGAVSNLFNSAGFQALIGTVLSGAISVLSGVIQLASGVIDSFRGALDKLKENGYMDRLGDAFGAISHALETIAESKVWKSIMDSTFKHSLETVVEVIEAVGEALEFIADLIDGNIPGAIEHLILFIYDIGGIIAKSVLAPIQGAINAFSDWVYKISNGRYGGDHVSWVESYTSQFETGREAIEQWFDSIGATSEKKGEIAGNHYRNGVEHGGGAIIEIDADTSEAEKARKNFADEVEGTVMNAPVSANTTKAKLEAQRLRNNINSTISTAPVNADTKQAQTQVNTFRTDVNTTTSIAPVDANTNNATTKYNTWKSEVDKGTTAPVKAEMKTGASTLYGTISTDWAKNVTGLGLKLPTESEITTHAKTMWNDVSGRWATDNGANNKHTFPIQSEITTWASTMWNDISGRWDSATYGKSLEVTVNANLNSWDLKRQAKEAFTGISVQVTGAGDLNKIAGNMYFQAYASGGFPNGSFIDSAQFFMARENGIPEYVGRFGSQSAVANNYQIVTGIAQGVSQAMVSQNELLREQNSLLREIATNGGNVSVSSVLGAMNRVNKRTGTPVVTMG